MIFRLIIYFKTHCNSFYMYVNPKNEWNYWIILFDFRNLRNPTPRQTEKIALFLTHARFKKILLEYFSPGVLFSLLVNSSDRFKVRAAYSKFLDPIMSTRFFKKISLLLFTAHWACLWSSYIYPSFKSMLKCVT